MRKNLVPRLLLLAALAPSAALVHGCAVVAGGAVVFILSQEFIDNATEVTYPNTTRQVWTTTKATLSQMSNQPITVDDDMMAAEAIIDGANVVVHVEVFDEDETRLMLTAKKYGVFSKEIVDIVLDRIRQNLHR